jgi:hypothetical protein
LGKKTKRNNVSKIPNDIDHKLWVILKGERKKKCYIYYNPHTFKGRIAVWRNVPFENNGKIQILYISTNDIARSSVESKYWINGYISGSEPEPPVVSKGNVKRMIFWRKAIKIFHKTGVWVETKRKCKKCKKELLPSIIGNYCDNCKK